VQAEFEHSKRTELAALHGLLADALARLGDAQKQAARVELADRSCARQQVAVLKECADATVARQRQALARRECLQLRSSHSVSRHRALFRREVEAAAAREGRAMAQQRAAAAATAAAERRRSRSTSRRGRRRASHGGDSDASTYYSGEGGSESEEEAGSSVAGSRRHSARARAAAASRLPRPSPFFGPRAVDHVTTHMDADVCVTSSLARVGHGFHTMVASAVRAPTVVVRQRRRSRGRGGSVSSGGTGAGGGAGGGCGGSVMTDARSHASATSAALAEARRREGALAAQRRAAARERGRAAGCALRQEREGRHALETLARLDAASAAAAFAASSGASSASERGGHTAAATGARVGVGAGGASSAAPRCLAASIPIVRPAFMAGRGGGESERAAPWPPQPSSHHRDGLGADRMDLRSDDVAAYSYAAPIAGGGATGRGEQPQTSARASAGAARSGAALSVPAGTQIGGAGIIKPLLLSPGVGHRVTAAWPGGAPFPAGVREGGEAIGKEEAAHDHVDRWGYGPGGHGARVAARGTASVDLSALSAPSGTSPAPPRLRAALRPTSAAEAGRPAERASTQQRRPASEAELEAAFEDMLLAGM